MVHETLDRPRVFQTAVVPVEDLLHFDRVDREIGIAALPVFDPPHDRLAELLVGDHDQIGVRDRRCGGVDRVGDFHDLEVRHFTDAVGRHAGSAIERAGAGALVRTQRQLETPRVVRHHVATCRQRDEDWVARVGDIDQAEVVGGKTGDLDIGHRTAPAVEGQFVVQGPVECFVGHLGPVDERPQTRRNRR